MRFEESVRTCLAKYAVFGGRATRPEYWWFFLFNVLVGIAAGILDGIFSTYPVIEALATLALLVPGIAVAVRRLHDTNRPGWWYLILLIPIVGIIVMVIFLVQPSDPADNQYGPAPYLAGPSPI